MFKMRRLTAYVAGSVGLASLVVSYAFYERPNFYSAAVYLSQSSACLLVLSNLALLTFIGTAYALQSLVFGQLRAIEIEQLYERGWIAATEWLFAMSIFRDEFGPWYMTMFLLLFFGKVWGWLSDGRIEALEQQDPSNPVLFHSRLSGALLLYILGSLSMLLYCLDEVIYEATPGVMIMFVFEWAIICISVIATCAKYGLWAYERKVIRHQETERRAELRREAQELGIDQEDQDVQELDLPGWEGKSTWLFGLDIATDLLKLIAYLAFFCVLTMFYGIPIYIIRDLYMTMRSFIKRITDYIKYENATRDMHNLYPDATREELDSDNTCIICREEMYPWIGNNQNPEPNQDGHQHQFATTERKRPKKLPCGHVLHFHCLRSWLERQQVCPTCRRSVLRTTTNNPQGRPQEANNGQNAAAGAGVANQQDQNQPQPQAPGARDNEGVRDDAVGRRQGMAFQLGPLRLQFGVGLGLGANAAQRLAQAQPQAPPPPPQPQAIPQLPQVAAQQQPPQPPPAPHPAAAVPVPTPTRPEPPSPFQMPSLSPLPSAASMSALESAFPDLHQAQPIVRHHILHTQLNAMEAFLWQEIGHARVTLDRIGHLRVLQQELARSRGQMEEYSNAAPIPSHLMNGPLGDFSGPASTSLNLTGADGTVRNSMPLPPGWRAVPLSQPGSTPDQNVASASASSLPSPNAQPGQTRGFFQTQGPQVMTMPGQNGSIQHSSWSVSINNMPHIPRPASIPSPGMANPAPITTSTSSSNAPAPSLTLNGNVLPSVPSQNGNAVPPNNHRSEQPPDAATVVETSSIGPVVTQSWSFGDIPTESSRGTTVHNAEEGNDDNDRGRGRQATVEDVPEEDID